jgi:hypothetical protein
MVKLLLIYRRGIFFVNTGQGLGNSLGWEQHILEVNLYFLRIKKG